MNKVVLILASLFVSIAASSQELYFPPVIGNTWETTTPAELGWCEDEIPALLQFIDESDSKAFIVLKDGKIVIEHYVGTFTQDSLWYWASAGKSLTAFLIGLAQQNGDLDINDASNIYLGDGWTSLTPEQENAITVRNHLTMTTGLDDTDDNFDCLDPECLTYLEDPGERWAYHNGPYTLLDSVMYYATGQNLNAYVFDNLSLSTGIFGSFIFSNNNNVFVSKARAMARFGLLALNQGTWASTPILTDEDYFYDMTHTSQELNKAYGYLWWLNGSADYMLPGIQFQFPGPLMVDAPMDVFAAMGKNGQIINVSPSENLVVVRMGNEPTNEVFYVPNVYNNQIWQYLNPVICTSTSTNEWSEKNSFEIYPNPASDVIRFGQFIDHISIYDATGVLVHQTNRASELDITALSSGLYILNGKINGTVISKRFTISR